MRTRDERRARKAQIKAKLRLKIDKALARDAQYNATRDPRYQRYVETERDLERRYYRAEGRTRVRIYHCACSNCDYCQNNLTHSVRMAELAADQEYIDWKAGRLDILEEEDGS